MATAAPRVTGPPSGDEDAVVLQAKAPPAGDPVGEDPEGPEPGDALATDAAAWVGVPYPMTEQLSP